MKFLSVCSGIEAASVAWTPLGWKPLAFAEIEPFPCAVLAHRYPDVPNWGDMTRYQEWPDAAFDVLCGGTPCQSFSVAGLGEGLRDPRGQLMLTFGEIAARYRPRWLVWENVPGVLSSRAGEDFAALLGLLTGQEVHPPAGGWQNSGVLAGIPEAYGVAWRVLDAQYFHLAQRRERVFLVGYLGDWRPAAAVLLERESLSWNPAPRREAGETPARPIAACPPGGSGYRNDADTADNLIPEVAGTLLGGSSEGGSNGKRSGSDNPGFLVSHALTAKGGQGYMDATAETMIPVAHTLRGEGFDASEDGTGRGTPLVPCPVDITNLRLGHGVTGTLEAGMDRGNRGAGVLAFDTTQITSKTNRSNPQPGDGRHPLAAGAHAPTIAFHGTQDPDVSGPVTHPVGRNQGQEQAALIGTRVRRLTPRECERLQGFPDDYTLIPTKAAKKMEADYFTYLRRAYPTLEAAEAMRLAKDGPRYKALGNSWATHCARWIGQRIDDFTAILGAQSPNLKNNFPDSQVNPIPQTKE